MKTIIILILSLILTTFSFSQNDSNILVLNQVQDKIIPQNGKVIKEISVRRTEKRTLEQLIEQVKDSAKFYGGNCFLITKYDLGDPVYDLKTMRLRDYMQGQVYLLDSLEKQFLKTQATEIARKRDSLKVNYSFKDIELLLGFDLGGFRLAANEGYAQEHNEVSGDTYGSLYLIANRNWKLPTNRNASFKFGAGFGRTAILFNPNVTLQETGIADMDTVKVVYIDNREFQVLFPLGFSYTFPHLLEKGSGLKLVLGLENRFQVGQRDMRTVLFGDSEHVYEDDNHVRLATEYYTSFLNPYTLLGSVGFGITTHNGIGCEAKYTRFLIHPFLKGQQLRQQFIFSFQIDFQLLNLNRGRR
jgi:hypothetical protein